MSLRSTSSRSCALPHLEHQHALAPLLRRAEAVDARDGRDDDDVAAREERGRRREPKPRDVVVPGRVLLDVEVGLRDVRLGLEVVVVRDEVLDRVLGEELAELVAELRRERLVVRDDERGPLEAARSSTPSWPSCPSRSRRGSSGSGSRRPTESAISPIARGWSPMGAYMVGRVERAHRVQRSRRSRVLSDRLSALCRLIRAWRRRSSPHRGLVVGATAAPSIARGVRAAAPAPLEGRAPTTASSMSLRSRRPSRARATGRASARGS